jgi:hypothetical protein
MTGGVKNSTGCLTLLSQLLLGADETKSVSRAIGQPASYNWHEEINRTVAGYGPVDFGELWGLATSNHVIMRAFPGLHRVMVEQKNKKAEWAEQAILNEQSRVDLSL